MARLVDCCPSSDDELPMPDVLVRTPNVKQKKTLEQEMKTPGPAPATARRELVPKSTVKPSARKIRRLGGPAPLSQNPLFKRWGNEEGNGPFGMASRAKSPKKTTHLFEEDMVMEEPETTRKLQSTPELKVPSQYAASPIAAGNKSVNVTRFDLTNTSFALTPGGQNLSDRLKRSFAASPIKSRQLKFDLDSIDASEETSDDEAAASTSASAFDSSSNKSFEQDSQVSQESLQVEEYTRFVGTGDVSASNDSYSSESEFQTTNSLSDESALNMSLDNFPAVVQPIKLSLKPLDNIMKARDANVSPMRSPLEKPKQQIAKDMELAGKENAAVAPSDDFTDDDYSNDAIAEQLENDCRFQTPPATPQKSNKTLLSPKKSAKIPSSPHKPDADAFWSQENVDGWNETHSPKKAIRTTQKTALSSSPKKKKDAAFESSRHELAVSFLQELDQEITEGKVAELAEPTGGVSIVWSKTLNTTAGRANWKRQTIKNTSEDGEQTVEYKHFASIELAEKVINDEEKLLNVIAHEFCHLANFMVNGITNNPHGKEFKVWAAKCTRTFADRGINVTTKHSYDIEYKYIWQCVECKSEYKRHSKSINPEKHRCGGCKSKLAQIRPVPRTKTKPTAYQLFIKEHMKLLKEENPGVAQKEIMKMAAEKWASTKTATQAVTIEDDLLDDVVGQLGGLKLEATT